MVVCVEDTGRATKVSVSMHPLDAMGSDLHDILWTLKGAGKLVMDLLRPFIRTPTVNADT
jgi:hypothetical protein